MYTGFAFSYIPFGKIAGYFKGQVEKQGMGNGNANLRKREEMTARKNICSLTPLGMTRDGAHGDLVHKPRNTTRDFEFHLYCLVQQSKLYEKRIHMPTWIIDTVIITH